MGMNTSAIEKPKRNARVAGVSFAPDVWDYLNAEVERQGHRNRSLVIERALNLYREVQDAKADGGSVVIVNGKAS